MFCSGRTSSEIIAFSCVLSDKSACEIISFDISSFILGSVIFGFAETISSEISVFSAKSKTSCSDLFVLISS